MSAKFESTVWQAPIRRSSLNKICLIFNQLKYMSAPRP